jgi:hypothetical protein
MRVAHNPHVYYRDHSMLPHHLLQKLTHNPFKDFGTEFYYILLTVDYNSQFVAPNYQNSSEK